MIIKNLAVAAFAFALGGYATGDIEAPAATMQVRGRHIYSAAGERVILRGVNEMFAISKDPTGSWLMGEIAKTGANAVRIFTLANTPAGQLDALISKAIENGMIPIPECHTATGKWERLPDCVNYWTSQISRR